MGKQAVWLCHYPVASYLVDFNKRLSLQSVISVMQESAWIHSAHLEQGYLETTERGVAWVLVRQRVEMDEWPEWGQTLTVRTWLRPPGAAVVTRDFELLVGESTVGRACAHWITIDHVTRRPIPLVFKEHAGQFREDFRLDIDPLRLPVHGEGQEVLAEFEVRAGDLDMNRHANNTRFAQWVLDALPWAVHERQRLRGYQVNFLAEAKLGDRVAIRCKPSAPGAEMDLQGWRARDGKALFTARLEAAPL